MMDIPEPFTVPLPTTWTPEQACFVQAFLEELLEQIDAHYGSAIQQWLSELDAEVQAYREQQTRHVETDFDDPLPF